jgi:hypothetical protein
LPLGKLTHSSRSFSYTSFSSFFIFSFHGFPNGFSSIGTLKFLWDSFFLLLVKLLQVLRTFEAVFS